jgi:hypothetical protein
MVCIREVLDSNLGHSDRIFVILLKHFKEKAGIILKYKVVPVSN